MDGSDLCQHCGFKRREHQRTEFGNYACPKTDDIVSADSFYSIVPPQGGSGTAPPKSAQPAAAEPGPRRTVYCDKCGIACLEDESLRAGRCSLCRPKFGANGYPGAAPAAVVAGVGGDAPTTEPGHPEFLRLLDEMRAVHQRKAADYGTRGDDPLANLRASEAFGIPAWVGAVMRCNDKMKRVQSFVKNGELKNESVEDSLLDGAAYFLLALVLFREATAAGKGGAK
jgi:hypothetical protein